MRFLSNSSTKLLRIRIHYGTQGSLSTIFMPSLLLSKFGAYIFTFHFHDQMNLLPNQNKQTSTPTIQGPLVWTKGKPSHHQSFGAMQIFPIFLSPHAMLSSSDGYMHAINFCP